MQNASTQTNTGNKISDFVQRNRKFIFTITGVIVFLFLGLIVYVSVSDHLQKKAIAEVEELNQRFVELRLVVPDQYYADDVDELLADLNEFVKNRKGFAGSRAWTYIAQLHAGREEWQQAEEAWYNAARTGFKTYLAPVAFFNAAAAAEEQGDYARAIEHLENCVSHTFAFPAAPRAQFAIGRLNEQLENYQDAIEAYRVILISWPTIDVWVNLAHSRIAAIESM